MGLVFLLEISCFSAPRQRIVHSSCGKFGTHQSHWSAGHADTHAHDPTGGRCCSKKITEWKNCICIIVWQHSLNAPEVQRPYVAHVSTTEVKEVLAFLWLSFAGVLDSQGMAFSRFCPHSIYLITSCVLVTTDAHKQPGIGAKHHLLEGPGI